MNTVAKRFYSSTNAVIVGCKRTPIGSFMGGLSDMSSTHLGTAAARAALASCNVDPTEVDEVFMGQVL